MTMGSPTTGPSRAPAGIAAAGRHRSNRDLASQTGLTLVETVIMLTVVVVLASIMAPAGLSLVEQARDLQVQRDCASRSDAIETPFTGRLFDAGGDDRLAPVR